MDGGGDSLISARGLTRIYPSGNRSVIGVVDVNLEISEAAFVVLKGRSGSGKSTLLSMLAGLDRPTRGRLTVAGKRLTDAGEAELTDYRRLTAGMVFQSFNLLPTLTAAENIRLPAILAGKPESAARKRAGDLIGWMGMEDRAGHFPDQLSGGEMQRVAIARALINDPKIIFADEPTGNLDTQNGRAVTSLLSKLNRERACTVVVATHGDLVDPYATREIRLKDGRLET
jgi:ABC-type lipoprotein export system ATPase subunit